MSDPTTDNSAPEVFRPAREVVRSGPTRVWLLLAWITLLAAICFWLKSGDFDPGVGNSAINASVILSILGYSIWTLSSSGWGFRVKWGMALLPFGLMAAFYTQLLPVEVLMDGDVGIVGWRWRWNQPDKQLEVPVCASAETLDWQTTTHDYPRFLGNGYWAEVPGVTLETDWQASPPQEMWRKKIGAGWSLT